MWTIVIDDDLGSLKSLDEAIKQTDSNALVQSFTSWLDFFHWLQKIEKKDPSVSIPQMKLRAVFLCVDRLKDKEIVLLPKLKSLLKQLGLIDEVELLSLVLIGFDKPGLEMHKFMSAAYANFLFKPFDKLLLRQSVDIALNEKGPIKNYFVNNFKASVPIEMLKEIRLAEVTEIGFHTISDQKVESGRLAKYYADFLTTNMHRSSLARAYASRLLSGREFEIDMGFYALDQAQSLNLQKMIQSQKKTRPLPDFPGHRDNYTFVFFKIIFN